MLKRRARVRLLDNLCMGLVSRKTKLLESWKFKSYPPTTEKGERE